MRQRLPSFLRIEMLGLAVLAVIVGWGRVADAALVPVGHPIPSIAVVTLDSDTGSYWLDLTETTGLSYADIEAGAGGLAAAGWRHATIDEVCDLFERYLVPAFPPAMSCPLIGVDPPTAATSASVATFLQFLGNTGFDDGIGAGTAGFAAGAVPPDLGAVMQSVPAYYAGTFATGYTPTSVDPTIDHYMVRATDPFAVPGLQVWGMVAAAALLAACGAMLLRTEASQAPTTR